MGNGLVDGCGAGLLATEAGAGVAAGWRSDGRCFRRMREFLRCDAAAGAAALGNGLVDGCGAGLLATEAGAGVAAGWRSDGRSIRRMRVLFQCDVAAGAGRALLLASKEMEVGSLA